MSGKISFKYHLPHRTTLSVIFTGMWVPMLWVAGNVPIDTMLFIALNVAVILAGIWNTGVMTIDQNGVVLYRINKLAWSDMSSAKRVKFLGLPYIRVGRKKGLPFWLPLYFKGQRPIEEALLDCAPASNVLNQLELDAKIS